MERELARLTSENERLNELVKIIQKTLEKAVESTPNGEKHKPQSWIDQVREVKQKCSTLLALIKIVRGISEQQTAQSIRNSSYSGNSEYTSTSETRSGEMHRMRAPRLEYPRPRNPS